MSEKTEKDRSERAKVIEGYFGMMTALLTKGNNTATGTTDDKTPAEPAQTKEMSTLITDGRKLANFVFSKARPQVIAEAIVTSMAYDVTQASTRLSKLYNMSRDDCYKQATKDLKVRKDRLANKMGMMMSVIKAAQVAEKDLEPKQ